MLLGKAPRNPERTALSVRACEHAPVKLERGHGKNGIAQSSTSRCCEHAVVFTRFGTGRLSRNSWARRLVDPNNTGAQISTVVAALHLVAKQKIKINPLMNFLASEHINLKISVERRVLKCSSVPAQQNTEYTQFRSSTENCQQTMLANHGLRVAKPQGFYRAPSSSIYTFFLRGDGPNHHAENRLGDCIGHVLAGLLVHRSERTRPVDVLDDAHDWVSEPKDHGRVASRGKQGPLSYWTPACWWPRLTRPSTGRRSRTGPWPTPSRTNLRASCPESRWGSRGPISTRKPIQFLRLLSGKIHHEKKLDLQQNRQEPMKVVVSRTKGSNK